MIPCQIWRRWCQQILAALCYLHELDIIHGNLTLDTIFIQHNGLVKIGSSEYLGKDIAFTIELVVSFL